MPYFCSLLLGHANFGDEMFKVELDGLKPVECEHGQNQFKEVLFRGFCFLGKNPGKPIQELANHAVFRV